MQPTPWWAVALPVILSALTLLLVIVQLVLMARQTKIMGEQRNLQGRQNELAERQLSVAETQARLALAQDEIVKAQLSKHPQLKVLMRVLAAQTGEANLEMFIGNDGTGKAEGCYWQVLVPASCMREAAATAGIKSEVPLDGSPHVAFRGFIREPLFPKRQTRFGRLHLQGLKAGVHALRWQVSCEEAAFPGEDVFGKIDLTHTMDHQIAAPTTVPWEAT